MYMYAETKGLPAKEEPDERRKQRLPDRVRRTASALRVQNEETKTLLLFTAQCKIQLSSTGGLKVEKWHRHKHQHGHACLGGEATVVLYHMQNTANETIDSLGKAFYLEEPPYAVVMKFQIEPV
ncbi:uncharacterized protein SPSK_03737 [Sporothrix schenckii 1099-18]|uniref:Uncharacterized protein n=1 Tax=Sporothrix schenckii 1099-18 TaxID=1397361 RepID=A0A0F2M0X3_SPOSC|nr:uncharacterized protein SPSK_03737 [Sporothrix schenckii 1099-18]KJR82729.1 hypothetical protein SPSK_03737 [Sporothrix schenckii 1099-18]